MTKTLDQLFVSLRNAVKVRYLAEPASQDDPEWCEEAESDFDACSTYLELLYLLSEYIAEEEEAAKYISETEFEVV